MAPKVFYRSRRIRQKNLIEIGEYAITISAIMKNSRDPQLFALHEIISEYAKRILAHMEKTGKKINVYGYRYFAVFSLYAYRHKLEPAQQLFNQTKKKLRS